jgi:transposase
MPTPLGTPPSVGSIANASDPLNVGELLLREEGVSFQRIKTWKASGDPDDTVKKARVEHLYAIANGELIPEGDDPTVVFLSGPVRSAEPDAAPRSALGRDQRQEQGPRPGTAPSPPRHLQPQRRRPAPVRRLRPDPRPTVRARQDPQKRTQFLEFCRYLRSLYPPDVRIAIVCDNNSPHLSTRIDQRVGDWAAANNVEVAYTPTNSSWLNRIEAQFTALRYFALDGTDHRSHKEQGSMIRRYIIWRNRHADDTRLRQVVARANVA